MTIERVGLDGRPCTREEANQDEACASIRCSPAPAAAPCPSRPARSPRACGGRRPSGKLAHELCRRGARTGSSGAAPAAASVLVACTQEAPAFRGRTPSSSTALGFVNIREAAGWSAEAAPGAAQDRRPDRRRPPAARPGATADGHAESDGVAVIYGTRRPRGRGRRCSSGTAWTSPSSSPATPR